MKSVISYPERGEGGSNKYRGNCSPKLLEDLFSFYKPKKVFDPMCADRELPVMSAKEWELTTMFWI